MELKTKPKSARILVAEDAEDIARILTVILTREGYTITHAPNGEEAYKLITTPPFPDLIITDIMMPGLSGFELLSKLKEDNCRIPVIVLTGKESEEDVLKGFSYGILDYITKPFIPSVLLAKIKLILSQK